MNLTRRIHLLSWASWLLPLASLLLAYLAHAQVGWMFASLFFAAVIFAAIDAWRASVRRAFIREARLPAAAKKAVRNIYPQLSERDADLVSYGLRQFFIAYSRSKHQAVGMPSKVVDAAWHGMILHTKAYGDWCDVAFGKLMHHTPAEAMGASGQRNDALRRTWYWACKEESIDPRNPSRLPLLFALDAKFNIEGGYRYKPDCKAIDQASDGGTYCATDFSSGGGGEGGFSGDGDGFGGSDASGGGDGGGGCGGGD